MPRFKNWYNKIQSSYNKILIVIVISYFWSFKKICWNTKQKSCENIYSSIFWSRMNTSFWDISFFWSRFFSSCFLRDSGVGIRSRTAISFCCLFIFLWLEWHISTFMFWFRTSFSKNIICHIFHFWYCWALLGLIWLVIVSRFSFQITN